MRPDLPTGTVTFLFTDVEGSTRLLHELGPEDYAAALAEHRRLIREACASQDGVEVDTQGDAFFFAFPGAPGALEAASAITEGLDAGPISVRIGLHTGTPLLTEEGYVGDDVHFAARVAATGHGGQVIVSATVAALIEPSDKVSQGPALRDLGEHRLKDIEGPVAIFQLGNEQFPPLKTISNTNLPRPASSFVGRERELEEVLGRVRGGARLVSLTGPGGSGKTRLALEAAASLVPEYKAGVFWVGLAALRDPGLVLETVSQTLGAKDGLAEHIAERELLLLLDNLEQVIEAAPELSTLLTVCPNLTLLVTSRELLRVQGEVEYPVPPLAESEAVSLFCERSQTAPSEEIAELCRRLDSLPLAVELAAARTKALSPAQILDRLSQRLDLLKGGRDADARHETLRATIEWSYDLLPPEEQQLFARLSVFAGGCTLEAAEEVCGADLGTLQSLVEKSLLRFSDERYWMLETIREYAGEHLERTGEAGLVFERLARHLVAVAEAEGAPTFLERQPAAFARLEQEHPNVRAAVGWALGEHRYEPVLRLLGVLWAFWTDSRHVLEALGWVNIALAEWRAASAEVWLPALLGASEVARYAGDLTRANELKELLVQALARHEAPQPWWETGTLADLADIAVEQGDLVRAREYAERSLALVRARDLPAARPLASLGNIALREGELDRAAPLLEEAARGWKELGHEVNYAATLALLGEAARLQGDLGRASELFAEALVQLATLGDPAAVGACLQDLALVASERGQLERAGRLWGAGQALQDASGIGAARSRMEPAMDVEARRVGAAMTLDEAVGLALEALD